MVELSKKEREALEALRRFEQEKKNTPPSERIPVARPERFDFPIGVDDEGRKFPVTGEDAGEDNSDRQ